MIDYMQPDSSLAFWVVVDTWAWVPIVSGILIAGALLIVGLIRLKASVLKWAAGVGVFAAIAFIAWAVSGAILNVEQGRIEDAYTEQIAKEYPFLIGTDYEEQIVELGLVPRNSDDVLEPSWEKLPGGSVLSGGAESTWEDEDGVKQVVQIQVRVVSPGVAELVTDTPVAGELLPLGDR